jgi:inner membrane protein
VDNVTHALAGLLVAEAVVQGRRRKGPLEPGFRAAAYWVSALGNSLPDADFVYTGITSGKLGYLLHHRGHTHTLAFVPVAALLLLAGVFVWERRRDVRLGGRAWRWLGLLAFLGPLLHLALDATNNYGVHPFWPLDNRWFYGDGVFIIEPYLLAFAISGLYFSTEGIWARVILWLIGGVLLAAVWLTDYVPPIAGAIFTAVFAWLLVFSRRASPLVRVSVAIGAWFGVTAVFFVCSQVGRAQVVAERGSERVLDVVMTPVPATPLCWSALSVELEGSTYRTVRAKVAPFPLLVDRQDCPDGLFDERTAPRMPLEEGPNPAVGLNDAFVADVTELRALAEAECHARAFLTFARAPYWTDAVIGDLRYDREPALGFAELPRSAKPCPRFLPPWEAPRADVLRPR